MKGKVVGALERRADGRTDGPTHSRAEAQFSFETGGGGGGEGGGQSRYGFARLFYDDDEGGGGSGGP